LPGLVIGDTSRLDPAVEEEFRQTGLTHLTAVSGANLAIVVSVVLFALRWCRVGPAPSAAVCALALAGFVVLARPSPSVLRAAAMGAIGLVALASGRPRLAAPALATAVIIGMVIDPGLAVDAGFALSVLATGALILLAPRWCDALRSRGVPAGLATALAAPAAAQLACGPVIAALSGGVSLVAVPANLAAGLAVAPATLLGLGAAVVSPVSPGFAALLAWCASWPARWLVAVAHAGAGAPAGTLPWPAGLPGALLLAAASVALVLVVRRPRARRAVLAATLAAALGALPIRVLASGWPAAGAVVVACDVGQGDALVLPVAPGQAVVVDAGPDPVLVDGCLSRLGVSRIPLLVLTHFHADHVDGITGVLRHRAVDRIVAPDFDDPEVGYREVALLGRPLTTPTPGWTYRLGGLTLTLLGPIRRQIGTHSDPNNNSLVLRATNGSVSVLLAGDAEAEEQHDLLDLGPDVLRVDVLKLAHHGSSYQDEKFLATVDASVVLVSVGEDNPYGHPNVALLDRLAHQGARVVRTDHDGDSAVVVTGAGLAVVTRGRSHK
jgi:competence protein ComEC